MSKLARAANANHQARTELLKGLLVEQVVEGYKQAISFKEDKNGQSSIVVQKTVKLQKPPSKSTSHPVRMVCA